VERALDAIEFFKTRHPEHILRTLRSLSFRAAPDAREITLLRAIALEVVRYLERTRSTP
jgi:tRNA/rRNA methyltransferase/tRNA (cytidine32/uridine32-2'-O)-methyltransferase